MDIRTSRDFTKSELECMLHDEAAEPKALPFSLLKKITNNFCYTRVIDKGGSAMVYEGILNNGSVAIKKLSHQYEYEKQFLREVKCLKKVKHKNIVQLLGYCSHTPSYDQEFSKTDLPERLLCLEYLPKGSLATYIKDASGGLGWTTRYRIIKGICEGLHYLHNINIMHLDLKPSNILMNNNMIPKIIDFGLSRSIEELQTLDTPTKRDGTKGYLAPEFTNHVVSHKSDLYSLGVIIMEILTGAKERQIVEKVLESWDKRWELSDGNPHSEQIRVCVEIGLECTDVDPTKRPTSTDILDRLAKTERTKVIPVEYSYGLLKVRPPELLFPLKPNKPIACVLRLTNDEDEHVAFALKKTGRGAWLDDCSRQLQLYGIVPPRSTYTLIVTTKETKELLRETFIILILQSSVANEHISPFKLNDECDQLFEQVKKKGGALNEVALKVCCDPYEETTSKIISHLESTSLLCSLDAHPTEPWITIGGYLGQVHIWNYDTQIMWHSFKVSERAVRSTKIVPRKQWILAGDDVGYIHVYQYGAEPRKIMQFKASTGCCIDSLAIHPTKPYVLSATYKYIHLWDWENNWKCMRTFEEHSNTILQVAFDPREHDCFVSASKDKTVKVWNLDSPRSSYTLLGHSGEVMCLDFFTRDDQPYMITGSSDGTAKIWDMEEKMCIYTTEEGFTSPLRRVISLPDSPYLLAASTDGLVRLCSFSDFKLEMIFDTGLFFSSQREARAPLLAYSIGSNRVVIGHRRTVAVCDIGDHKPVFSLGNKEISV